LNSGNALIQHLRGNAIFCVFPFYQVVQKDKLFDAALVKCLLIAYFIGNICAKKCQNPFTCVKVIATKRGTFLRHGVQDLRLVPCEVGLID